MKYTYFIHLTTIMYSSFVDSALPPDINLEGRLLTNNEHTLVQLICSTNMAVQLCSVEFLVDKRTHDNIRYYDNNCYHTIWICSPTVCACSDDCMSFTLNVTVPKDMMNHSYSCASRMEKEGVIYLANITVIHDGNGFKLFKKTVVPYSSVSSTQKATTFMPEKSTVSVLSVPVVIAITAFGFLSSVVSIIVVCRMWYSFSKKDKASFNKQIDKDRSSNDNSQCHQQNDKNNCHGTPNHHILDKDDSSGKNSSKREVVHQVEVETNSDGNRTRFSMASTISDTASVEGLIDNRSKRSGVKFSEKFESTYI